MSYSVSSAQSPASAWSLNNRMWVRQTATTQQLPGAELLDRLDKQPTKHLAHGGAALRSVR